MLVGMGGWRGMFALVAACGRVGFDDPGEGAPVVAPSDLVAWYGMAALDDAGDHRVVEDLTGHGHDATCTTTCPRVVVGRWGHGFAFDGAQFMSAGSAPDLEAMPELTIAAWIHVDAAPAVRAQPFTKSFGTGILNSWAVALETNMTVTVFADGAMQHGQTGSRVLATGAWHHVAFRWNGSRADSILDGALDTTATFPDIEWDAGTVNLGADYEFGAPISYFTGTLDDARVYRRALTDAEIADLAQ
jgi:Concanavalin A-like lectin/glucanases superfamily